MSDPLVGVVISERYRLTDVLGQGGMGIVYKAEDLRLNNRLCAVKLLKGQTTDPNEAKRFEAELQIISRLRSPHVVQVLDTGYFEGHRLYIIMELLEGAPLSQISKEQGAIHLPRAIQITKGILAGLSEAHEYGIVHRDLKPANIFITRSRAGDEITKVLDFGIAKDTNSDDSTGLTSASMIIGTPKYMAPEQFMKQPTDQRTDIYAVGLLMYQLIAGVPPFVAESELIPPTLATMPSEFKVGWLHLNADPVPLPIHQELWALLASMLAKEPNERPNSVTEIIERLNQVVAYLSQATGSFAPINTPSGSFPSVDDHSGPHSGPHSGAHGAALQLGQPSGPQQQVFTPTPQTQSSARREEDSATTGVPVIHQQLSAPAKRSGGAGVKVAVAALLLGGGGFGAWQMTRGPKPIVASELTCQHKINAKPSKAKITVKRVKDGRSMAVKSGQLIKRRCDERWEASLELANFEPLTLKLEGLVGAPNPEGTAQVDVRDVSMKIKALSAGPTDKKEEAKPKKRLPWKVRQRLKKEREAKERAKRGSR